MAEIKIDQLRPAFVFLAAKGKSHRQIATFFDIDRGTVSRAIKRFEETGSHRNRTGQGRKRTSTGEVKKMEVEAALERNNRTRRKDGIPASSTRKLGRRIGIPRMMSGMDSTKQKSIGPSTTFHEDCSSDRGARRAL